MNPTSMRDNPLGCVELRQYTLHPHKRDVLIDLFDREFVETQEAVGVTVMGQFRDLDDPDLFVWLRGFESMQTRLRSLTEFYDGPVWRAHADAANATMIDSDNVLLLRPAWEGAHLAVDPTRRAGRGAVAIPPGFIDITVLYLHEPASARHLAFCRERMQGVLDAGGAQAQGWYVTEPRENDFRRLPVRENEQVLMGVAVFPDVARFDDFGRSNLWASEIAPELRRWPLRRTESHRLAPTARSATHA
ncbi:MAG: NIPSNAP family protein [Bordetella sp.]|uniref:NIPSNAP family protein n=1 Tax=Bordetella sp. TaxID=28081 RepID=UPI003F7BADB2